ncbi:MAG: SDR family NAD(P)-dependent oxidoreductase [Solirubrobacteraceae bacterium]
MSVAAVTLVLTTGATRGVTRSSDGLARQGAEVVVVGREPGHADAVAREAGDAGGSAAGTHVDIGTSSAIRDEARRTSFDARSILNAAPSGRRRQIDTSRLV